MPIVCGCIAPHGDEIVEELVGKLDDKSARLADAMRRLAKEIVDIAPDTIIIATPHNLRIQGYIGIIYTSYVSGSWSIDGGSISIEAECDRDLAKKIYEKAIEESIPVVLVNYGVSEGKLSNMCLDWGTIIPLWFVRKEYERRNLKFPKVIVITPSREIEWEKLVSFGEVIYSVARDTDKKVVFIASADQGHAHDPNGPYGFDKTSEEFDRLIVDIVRNNSLEKLLDFDPKFIEKAKPDSLWQMLILYGTIKNTSFRNIFTVYECPTYFGMLVALFK